VRRGGKTALMARVMVSSIFGSGQTGFYLVGDARSLMAAFYRELNKQMPWRDRSDWETVVDIQGRMW
jgi:hypothetical protein